MFESESSFYHISHQLFSFFSLSSTFQVYVSYDYGKSFQKISAKLNFGVRNGSEAVIAQFYHSPADNKRVRKQLSPCDFMGLYFRMMAALGGWEVELTILRVELYIIK